MGNLVCNAPDSALLTAAARDFCPFPDYSPGPLYNILIANSSAPLSEHYAAVQASLTPQQQQDFTQSLRSTFGKEGKVFYGQVGVVALSLAVLFDTVARQVKGECVSDQEPIPGLFLKEPSGDYPPPVYIISKYIRLVPHVINNLSRMVTKTRMYLQEIQRALANFIIVTTTQQLEDVTLMNILRCAIIAEHMMLFSPDTNADVVGNMKNHFQSSEREHSLNCNPNVASERFLVGLLSLGERTKEAFKNCEPSKHKQTVIENIVADEWARVILFRYLPLAVKDKTLLLIESGKDFDLKANALGKWI